MDSTALQTFLAVAHSGSFSQAAEQLFLTQPAVSKRIAALEDELGISLFERIGRRVSLTQAGDILHKRAPTILLAMEDSRREIANLSGHVTGGLIMGTSHHIGLHRLPPVLCQYRCTYPQVDIDIRFLGSEAICHAVQAGELEIGVVTLPVEPIDELMHKVIWRDPLKYVVGKMHPLATITEKVSYTNTVSIEQISHYAAILPSRGTYTRELVEDTMAKEGARISCKLSTNYLETIKMLVGIGFGWSVLPETMVSKNLVVLNPTPVKLKLVRHLGVVWHPARTLSNAATAMLQVLAAKEV